MGMPLQPLLLSLQVSASATAIAFVLGLALALWLAKTDFRGKSILETVLSLPLILPPTVLGYYLLLILGRSGVLYPLGIRLIFTWWAAVIASTVVALPLMVQSSRAAIAAVDPMLEKAAATLGAPPWRVLFDVTLPLAWRGILAGMVLTFARSLGEFGATLMVAGNIPGKTQTLPLAIYDLVQANELASANGAVLLMTLVAFALLFLVRYIEKHAEEKRAVHA